MEKFKQLEKRLKEKTAVIGVIGLGYVGLPLVAEYVFGGFRVIGLDVVPEKIKMLNKGQSYIQDIPSSTMKKVLKTKLFKAYTDFNKIKSFTTVQCFLDITSPVGNNNFNLGIVQSFSYFFC